MLRLRWLLACLLMAALPLQGMAAVTLMLCGPSQAASHAQMHAGHSEHATHADHDHADHADHGAGHGSASGHAFHGAAQDAHHQAPSQDAEGGPDAGHKCGLCAAGCHSAAIAQNPRPLALTALPRAEAAEPFSGFHSRATTVPDKPPRA